MLKLNHASEDVIVQNYHENGYVIFEDFFTPDEVAEMRQAGVDFTKNLPDESERNRFDCVKNLHTKNDQFNESANNITVFFEEDALDENGRLLVPDDVSLNKVGHALHILNPTFRKYTFDNRIKRLVKLLKYEEPVIPITMYIYKNPRIGALVIAHQDSSYMYNNPTKMVGFWIALDDATLENGCLQLIPKSHLDGVHRRFVRNRDPNVKESLVYDRPQPEINDAAFVPVEVKKGACVMFDGKLIHKSEMNRSEKPRHAWTLHVMEQKNTEYDAENWCLPRNGFLNLYEN